LLIELQDVWENAMRTELQRELSTWQYDDW
jgi:hypothetical protein